MTTSDFLSTSSALLNDAGIETARLDIFVLMEDALGIDRAQLLARPDLEIPVDAQKVLDAQITRRMRHEPLAYIRGKSEFYGREFIVNEGVLVPRPESETIIDLLKKVVHSAGFLEHLNRQDSAANQTFNESTAIQIADIGTGSGALGITVALELKNSHVDLLEISPDAINTAKMNVIKFATEQNVIQSDLLAATSIDYDILLCNLPYVPESYPINKAAQFEPEIALFSGADGLNLYRQLFTQIDSKQSKPLLILSESLPAQHNDLLSIAQKSGYNELIRDDFVQAFQLDL